MVRPACIPWLLVLLFALVGQQRLGAVAEEHTGAHSLVHTRLAHTKPHLIAHTDKHGSAQKDSTGKELKDPNLDETKQPHDTDTPQQKLILATPEDGPNSNSSLADFPCPAAAAIAPCVCSVDETNNIDLDCTFLESEEQLEAIFLQDFPIKQLHGFNMANNSAIRVLENSPSDVSFERIDLYPGHFTLQAISDFFLLDSKFTLTYLRIRDSELLSGGFPFTVLKDMEVLEYLEIGDSSFTWLPRIESSSLKQLRFTHGILDVIEPGTFDALPNLTILNLFGNSLTELRAGTVAIHEGPMTFYGDGNSMGHIEPGAFFFVDAGSAASSELLHIEVGNNQLQSLRAGSFPLRNSPSYLYLYNNQLTSIEPGAIVLPEATDRFSLLLWLNDNQLTTLDEAVFGALLPFITPPFYLLNNPLSCGCDIAWLVTNETYIGKVDPDATCADGRNLHELDPQDYVDFC